MPSLDVRKVNMMFHVNYLGLSATVMFVIKLTTANIDEFQCKISEILHVILLSRKRKVILFFDLC